MNVIERRIPQRAELTFQSGYPPTDVKYSVRRGERHPARSDLGEITKEVSLKAAGERAAL